MLWGGLGLGVAAVAAVAFSLSGESAHQEPHQDPVALAAATPAPAAARPASAPAAAAVPASAPVEPAAAVLRDVPDLVAPAPQPSVTEVLAVPAQPHAKKDQLTQALERPAKKKEVEPKKAEKSPPKKAKETPARAAPKREDPDVAILAALMANTRGKKATPAEQLKVCKQYNAAGEQQCREQLCATVARKEPACKTKAPSNT